MTAEAIVAEHIADPAPVRDVSAFESAVLQSRHSAFGEDAYPTIFDKAGAILFALVKFHPLVDGNKRAGWLLSSAFLSDNGFDLSRVTNWCLVAGKRCSIRPTQHCSGKAKNHDPLKQHRGSIC